MGFAALTPTYGTELTIDFNHLSMMVDKGQFPGFSYADVEISVLFHEGSHGFDQRQRLKAGMNPMVSKKADRLFGEQVAYAQEALLFKGLGVPSPWGLWTPQEGFNLERIQSEAEESLRQQCRSGGCE